MKARYAISGTFACAVAVFVLIPQIPFLTGNLFFEGSGLLYNVRIAHFLFHQAAYPVLSQAPQYAHYQLSRTNFIQGNFYPALDEARSELLSYPDNTQTYYILGLTYGYLGRTHEAIDSFSKYIESHPGTWAGRNDKAWLQFRLGDIDGALETIQPIAKNFRYTPWVQNTYCVLLLNKKEFLKAEQACKAAQKAVSAASEEDWGRAYPGNDPRIYAAGLQAMRKTIEDNLKLIRGKIRE
ncbi:tetratricopeptide repeat protein [Candidatus Kaiserbacteria bacterium]|nr:tetratricopeptide repeat protein [Candidatus Kaiserbacteria bacterium]